MTARVVLRETVGALIARLIGERLDMVVGARRAEVAGAAYRHGHRFGNRLLTGMIGLLFGRRFNDILSGYRGFSRRFMKSFPALAAGFEAELTVHALALRMRIAAIDTPYRARPVGSNSKLSTWREGLRILLTIVSLFKEERPLAFFSALFALLLTTALRLAYPIVVTWLETGLVPRFPTAILASGITLLAFLSLVSGFILDTVTRGRREFRRLAYLAIPPVGETRGGA